MRGKEAGRRSPPPNPDSRAPIRPPVLLLPTQEDLSSALIGALLSKYMLTYRPGDPHALEILPYLRSEEEINGEQKPEGTGGLCLKKVKGHICL